MTLHIEISMDGAAFEGDAAGELGEMLDDLRDYLQLRVYADPLTTLPTIKKALYDSNGNACGRAWTTED